MTDEYYMKLALREAQKAYEAEEVPVGAIIVQSERIIARGYNQVEKLNDPTAHAEILALTSAFNFLGSKYLPGATLYVTIEPCLMCAGALYWSKIGKVVYGARDEKHGALDSFAFSLKSTREDSVRVLHPKTGIISEVLKEECTGLMKEFFNARR